MSVQILLVRDEAQGSEAFANFSQDTQQGASRIKIIRPSGFKSWRLIESVSPEATEEDGTPEVSMPFVQTTVRTQQ